MTVLKVVSIGLLSFFIFSPNLTPGHITCKTLITVHIYVQVITHTHIRLIKECSWND